jgi:teichuronic acid biosynthesis glycosyltransferase TuaC
MKILFVAAYLESDNTDNYTMPFIDRQMESLQRKGMKIIPFSLNIHKNKSNYIQAVPLIKRIVEKEKISIVHAHYLYSVIPCIIKKKTPVVLSLMGTDVLGKVGKKSKLTNWANKLFIRFFLPACDAVIVKSKEMEELVHHQNIHVIPNGVDFHQFKPMDMLKAKQILNLPDYQQIILFAGNPANPRKNYDLALRVYKKISCKFQNITIIPLKNIPHRKVPYYLNASSCLLLTSFNEGSPNVLKEALACNIPVVSVNVGDVAERLYNLDLCAVCNYDATELAVSVCRILETEKRPDLRNKVTYLDDRFIAEKIENLYLSLI